MQSSKLLNSLRGDHILALEDATVSKLFSFPTLTENTHGVEIQCAVWVGSELGDLVLKM